MGTVPTGWASRSVALIVCLGLAVFLAQRGFADVRYDLADLKEDPLYLRGSRPMIVVGVLLSLVFAAGVAVMRATHRRIEGTGHARGSEAAASDPATGPVPSRGAGAATTRVPLPRWWWILVAGWGGYLLGGAGAYAAGGPVDHPGVLRLTFGAPLTGSVEVAARCRTPPGQADVVARITSAEAGLRIQVLDPVTGAPLRYPEPAHVSVLRTLEYQEGESTLVVPGLPPRAPVYPVSDGSSGLVLTGPTVGYMDSYWYEATAAEFSADSGTLAVSATRSDPYGGSVNAFIPNDPWPEAFPLTVAWTCDRAAILPAPSPRPTRPATTGYPTPPPAPSRTSSSTAPMTVRVVTNGSWASIRIRGATLTGASAPVVEGLATATRDGDLLRVQQAAVAATMRRVVGATFALELAEVTSGGHLLLEIDGDRSGSPAPRAAITISNALRADAVPVFVFDSPLDASPRWSADLEASLLFDPVVVERGW